MGYREILSHYYTGCEHFHFRQLRRWVLWLAAQPVPLVSSGKLQRNARKTFSNHAGFGIL